MEARTVRVKWPFISVTVPLEVPSPMVMFAPISGSPLNSPSITVPVMVRSCATIERMATGTINKSIKSLFIFIILYYIIYFYPPYSLPFLPLFQSFFLSAGFLFFICSVPAPSGCATPCHRNASVWQCHPYLPCSCRDGECGAVRHASD